jgi:hypothetical protein
MPLAAQHAHELVNKIASSDRAVQGRAYEALLTATASMVPWAYDIWPAIVEGLGAPDNRLRSICAQILANLAACSDPEHRILGDLDRLAAVMRDGSSSPPGTRHRASGRSVSAGRSCVRRPWLPCAPVSETAQTRRTRRWSGPTSSPHSHGSITPVPTPRSSPSPAPSSTKNPTLLREVSRTPHGRRETPRPPDPPVLGS